MPARPSAAAARSTSTGKCLSSSQRAECGASSAAANDRAMSWMACWSSSRLKSTTPPFSERGLPARFLAGCGLEARAPSPSLHGGDDEGAVFDGAFRPAGGDGLDLGVEFHPLDA